MSAILGCSYAGMAGRELTLFLLYLKRVKYARVFLAAWKGLEGTSRMQSWGRNFAFKDGGNI